MGDLLSCKKVIMKKDLSFDEFSLVSEKDWQNKLSNELQSSSGTDKLLNFTTTSELTFAPLYWKTERNHEYPGFVPYRRGFRARTDFLQLKYNLNTPFTHDELYQVISYFPNILEYDARIVSVNQIELACRNLNSFLTTAHAHDCQYRLRVSEASLTTALLDSLGSSEQAMVVLDLTKIFLNRTENSLDLQYNLDLFAWSVKNSKRKIKLLFSGASFDDIGCQSNLQNALVLTLFCEVFEMLTERGLSHSAIFELIEFELCLSEKTFESSAQVRSFREMLYHVFVAKQMSCEDFHFPVHAVCSKRNFTALDFWQNILRSSSVVMSACFANVSSVTPLSLLSRLDELSLTTQQLPSNADAIAMNSYHLLIRESHLAQVADPMGGSYLLEDLTNQINEKTFELLQRISHAKSFYDFLKSSAFLELLQKTNKEELKIIHRRKKVVAGINEYPAPIDLSPQSDALSGSEQSFANGDSDASKLWVLKLRQVWHEKKGQLEQRDWYNLVAMFSDGMCLRQVQNILNSHAEFQFFTTFETFRAAAALENLRIDLSSDSMSLKKTLIYISGDETGLSNRINFILNILKLYNIQSEKVTNLSDVVDSDDQLVVLCTTDGNYLELIQTVTSKIKKSMLCIAGAAEISDDQLIKHRLERIKLGMDVYEFGMKLLKRFKLKGGE
jgi:hypothetical protein